MMGLLEQHASRHWQQGSPIFMCGVRMGLSFRAEGVCAVLDVCRQGGDAELVTAGRGACDYDLACACSQQC